jgi:hypothetical protein
MRIRSIATLIAAAACLALSVLAMRAAALDLLGQAPSGAFPAWLVNAGR